MQDTVSMHTQSLELDSKLLDHLLDLASNRCKSKSTHHTLHDYVTALPGQVSRHNAWQMAEFSGHADPFLFQHFLSRTVWDEKALVEDLINEHKHFLTGKPYSLIVDETGFIKKGNCSCGVQRQYSGTAGKVENCQIGVVLACTAKSEHCLLDTRLIRYTALPPRILDS